MIDSLLTNAIADTPAPSLVVERPMDAALVDVFIDEVFGPGRYAKTAERLREGSTPLPGLSFVCWRNQAPIGCVRQWPIHIGGAPAVFLGPFAVDPDARSNGLGAALIVKACDEARQAGHGAVLLVGDASFFSPLGFETVPPGRIQMPGPVDPRRVLWRALKPGGTDTLAGAVSQP